MKCVNKSRDTWNADNCGVFSEEGIFECKGDPEPKPWERKKTAKKNALAQVCRGIQSADDSCGEMDDFEGNCGGMELAQVCRGIQSADDSCGEMDDFEGNCGGMELA